MPAAGTSIAGTALYIQQRIRMVPSGCVEWTSTLNEDGYGKAVIGYKAHGRPVRVYAHRFTFEMWRGQVPTGMELDHLCRNRKCVNPLHLEPVTRKENVRRGLLPTLMLDPNWKPRRKIVGICKNGHEMTGENIGSNASRRWCRACRRAYAAKSYSKKRELK